jgi:hypothetical protein
VKLETTGMKSNELSDFARDLDFREIKKFQ